IVLFSLQGQIRMQGFRDKDSPAGLAVEAARQKNGENRLKAHLERRQAEAEKCRLVLDSLSGNLAKGVIDRAEYEELKKGYRIKLLAAEHKISEIREKMSRAAKEDKGVIRRWEQFEKYGNVTKLDRAMTAFMIDGIFICRNKRVEIVYNWR
ncbi:MAG: recombinase, partial [Lachnospiraceae bacterium]|nr:recombinase [Lachnospiraceae bacterium]